MRWFAKQGYIGISIQPDTITLSWVQKKPKTIAEFSLRAFETMPKSSTSTLTLYNLKELNMWVKTFIHRYQLQKHYASITVSGAGVTEKIVPSRHTPESFQTQEHKEQTAWDCQKIGHNQTTETTYYYVSGIPHHALFQYQLLALKTGLNCIKIIPQRMALFQACQFFDPHNHPSTTASITNHASLQKYLAHSISSFDTSCITRDANINAYPTPDQLLESIGLFLVTQELYEKS